MCTKVSVNDFFACHLIVMNFAHFLIIYYCWFSEDPGAQNGELTTNTEQQEE